MFFGRDDAELIQKPGSHECLTLVGEITRTFVIAGPRNALIQPLVVKPLHLEPNDSKAHEHREPLLGF